MDTEDLNRAKTEAAIGVVTLGIEERLTTMRRSLVLREYADAAADASTIVYLIEQIGQNLTILAEKYDADKLADYVRQAKEQTLDSEDDPR